MEQDSKRNDLPEDLGETAKRLRDARPSWTPEQLDSIKLRAMKRAAGASSSWSPLPQFNLRRSTKGASLRQRLIPVLVSLGLLGGTGFFAVEAVAAITASSEQYCTPSGSCSNTTTGAITITSCTIGTPHGSSYDTLTVTGTTTDHVNPVTVSSTNPAASTTVTPNSSGGFTAVLTTFKGYNTGGSYSLTAAQALGGTAKATCTT